MGWALGMLAFDAVLYITILLYADYAEEKASKAKSAGERKNHPIKLPRRNPTKLPPAADEHAPPNKTIN